MQKSIKNYRASIMLIVVIISASLMTLFLTIALMAKQYRWQVSSLEYWNLAENSVENAIEEAIIRYFEKSDDAYKKMKTKELNKDENWRRETSLYSAIINNFIQKTPFWPFDSNIPKIQINSKIKLNHQWIMDDLIWEVWKVRVNASRLKSEILATINPFEYYEFRLTAEEREVNLNWTQNQIKQLQITWNKVDWNPIGAELRIIQISWPINDLWKIETHILNFKNWWTTFIWDMSLDTKIDETPLFIAENKEYTWEEDFDWKEYIFLFKAKVNPILLKIEWVKDDWKKIKLPDRFVYFSANAKIDKLWWESEWKTYFKKLELKKEIYTNFDSNFDYSWNFINF